MSFIDRLIVGRVVKDLGTIYERSFDSGKEKYSGLLVERHGRYWYVVKSAYLAFFAPSVNYARVPLDGAAGLREQLDRCEQLVKELPPPVDNISYVGSLVSLVALMLAIVISLVTQNVAVVIVAALLAVFIQVYQYAGFKSRPTNDAWTDALLIIVPLATVLMAAARICWLTILPWR